MVRIAKVKGGGENENDTKPVDAKPVCTDGYRLVFDGETSHWDSATSKLVVDTPGIYHCDYVGSTELPRTWVGWPW